MGFISKSYIFSTLMSCTALFKKIADNLHNGLDPLPEPPAGLGQGVPVEGAQHLHDLGLQGLHIVVGALSTYGLQTPHFWQPWGDRLGGWEDKSP